MVENQRSLYREKVCFENDKKKSLRPEKEKCEISDNFLFWYYRKCS